MASDIKLHENNVVVEGGELHSAGPGGGFSFADRTQGDAGRWVLYAQDGKLRLWSQAVGKDIVDLTVIGGKGLLNCPDTLTCDTLRANQVSGANLIVTEVEGWNLGGGPMSVVFKSGISLSSRGIQDWRKFALTTANGDVLLINQESAFTGGVRIESNLHLTGVLTQASSSTLKENVAMLSGQEAMAALHGLNAVKFNYKADERKERHVGFIAEDVPDLVAKSDHQAVGPMDVVAVLTRVVQEQQRSIEELTAKVNALGS